MPPNEKRRPGEGGVDLCLAAGDRGHNYRSTRDGATLLIVAPGADEGRVRLSAWSARASLTPLGEFGRGSAKAIAARLVHGGADLFLARGAAL